MSKIGDLERRTQKRVVKYFQKELEYSYLGDWEEREGNANVEEKYLTEWLIKQGHSEKIISKVLFQLGKAKNVSGIQTLYDANRKVYNLLRYGVKVTPEMGEHHVTVHLIDWDNPENNDFAIAEEVTITGPHGKRPDVVLYVNGIALSVLELKRSTVSIGEGIRQNLDNQKKNFIRPFFATVQLILAGNDTEGVRYGVIETREKYFLHWKEESEISQPLEHGLFHLCRKDRLLEIIHDFIVFDAGTKKTCRHNQYFGVKASQERIHRREGGIVWHTQGSGKSLTMVWLAKWIRENLDGSRVLVITDRKELDDQIEKVFLGVKENIYRTNSGSDLVNQLNKTDEWLICSLIHKFGRNTDLTDGDVKAYVGDLEEHLPKDFSAKGNLFVFVDECHRTQSGKLHEAMKRLLPDAMFIGFTGTPLLKKDKLKSIEVFGPYIHTYKYNEAVKDGVVLDLRYEARDIDQKISSPKKIDEWFEAKTRELTDFAKAELKKRWGTLQKLFSSQDRISKIVNDVLFDMATKDRLKSGHGNALLVCGSIYQACKTYEMFQGTPLAGKCAIITSYQPNISDVKGEESGEGLTEKMRKYDIYRKMLAEFFDESEENAMHKTEEFEREVKKRFIEQPANMKLLIVVDKLLTGFSAPPATYLYIDKQMQDHGLFQAVCRVNRLHGNDKEYGYIIDYKDLFKSLENSIKDYTGEAFGDFDADDVAGLLKDRLAKGKERLNEVRESIKALCEPVEPPRDQEAFRKYFVGDSDNPESLKENEPKRVQLYKLTSSYLRAYAELANEMQEAGYSDDEASTIKQEVTYYEHLRQEIKLASGDYIELKSYEPAMRHLIDSYIDATDSEILATFDDMSLVELIVERGDRFVDSLPKGIRNNKDAMAETIENNIRKKIIDEMAVNPKYYDKMSELLDELIKARKHQAMNYKAYLEKVHQLSRQVLKPETGASYPKTINTTGLRSLYDNLDHNESLALKVDTAIRENKRDGWRGSFMKTKQVRMAIQKVLPDNDNELTDRLLEIVEEPKNGY